MLGWKLIMRVCAASRRSRWLLGRKVMRYRLEMIDRNGEILFLPQRYSLIDIHSDKCFIFTKATERPRTMPLVSLTWSSPKISIAPFLQYTRHQSMVASKQNNIPQSQSAGQSLVINIHKVTESWRLMRDIGWTVDYSKQMEFQSWSERTKLAVI